MQQPYRLKTLVVAMAVAQVARYGAPAQAMMQDMDDDALSAVAGQALFVTDKIEPNSLTAPGSYAGFTFYRMGMDIDLAMNMNIAKMQLGCGGVNDALDNSVCDIDMEYVQFMGRSGTNAGAVGSDFVLRRPYVELAIKNDGTTNREVVGIKIGAQSVDGYVGAGRRYTVNNSANRENGGTCNTGVVSGPGTLACHSGINSISGFLGTELSATIPIVCTSFLCPDSVACIGNTSRGDDSCGAAETLFIDVTGTRIKELSLTSLVLNIDSGLLNFVGITEGYAQILANLRLLHGFALVNSSDFFISFQRERVSWPRYSKTLPPTTGSQACNPAWAGTPPARCNSAYAYTANTGWWMNVPEAKLLNVNAPAQSLSLGQLFGALAAPGLPITNPEFGMTPPDNCYGAATFC